MVKTIAIRNPEVIRIAHAEVEAENARDYVEAVENIVLRFKREANNQPAAAIQAQADEPATSQTAVA